MHLQSSADSEAGLYDRYKVLSRIPRAAYSHGIAWLSEFMGTIFFLFLALAGEQVAFSAGGGAAALLYASLSYAFAFAVSSWIFFRVTSGL